MPDPLSLTGIITIFFGIMVWVVLNHCADAELHGNRLWWRKALFRAKQRLEYKEFCRDAERKHTDEEYAQQGEAK